MTSLARTQTNACFGRTALRCALLISPLLLSACYQRVVHDKQGNYVGTIYEGNLPEDSRGFWTDAFETNTIVEREESEEVRRIRRDNQALYDRQIKELDLGDLDTKNP